jgi:hypothetical protein
MKGFWGRRLWWEVRIVCGFVVGKDVVDYSLGLYCIGVKHHWMAWVLILGDQM